MHFGRLLAKLRTDRGLTQPKLAQLSGMSTPSIQRAEGAERCPLRRSSATDVLAALESVAPLTTNERENYLQLAGLEVLAKHAQAAAREARDRSALARNVVNRAAAAASLQGSPDENRAHVLLQRLMDHGGPEAMLSMLEGMARAMKLEVPAASGSWVYHSGPLDAGDGHTLRILAPASPAPTPPRPKAEPKRRAGA